METQNLSKKLHIIASTYLSLVSILQKQENSFYQSKPSNPYSKFCSSVEIAFLSLPRPLRRIINNDFFYQDYPGWWKLSYHKSQYLKLKDLAIKKFMEAYYEIN